MVKMNSAHILRCTHVIKKCSEEHTIVQLYNGGNPMVEEKKSAHTIVAAHTHVVTDISTSCGQNLKSLLLCFL